MSRRRSGNRVGNPGRSAAEVAAIRRLCWERSCQGWTQDRIAQELGITQTSVSTHLAAFRKAMTPVDRELLRQQHHERARMAHEALSKLAGNNGAPVTAGKDGVVVYDPVTGEVVRDYAGIIAAWRELRAWDEREAKLANLDEQVHKVEQTIDVTVHDSVDAELQALANELGLNDNGPSTKDSEAGATQSTMDA